MGTAPSPQKQPVREDAHALVQAAGRGNTHQVKAFLAAGTDVNVTVDNGKTALMAAASGGHLSTVRLLLEAGANVNAERADGFTALISAVFFGHTDVVRALLDRNAAVTAQTRQGMTAQKWASIRGFTEIAQLLEEAESATIIRTPPTEQSVPAPKVAGRQTHGSLPPGPDESEDATLPSTAQVKPAAAPKESEELVFPSPTPVELIADLDPAERGEFPLDSHATSNATDAVSADVETEPKNEEKAGGEGNGHADRARRHKRSELIRERIRESDRKRAHRASPASPPLPVTDEAPLVADAVAPTITRGARVIDRRERWGVRGSKRSTWGVAAVVAFVMLVASSASLYTLLQDANRSPAGDLPPQPVKDYYTGNEISVPRPAERKKPSVQTNSNEKIPAPISQMSAASRTDVPLIRDVKRSAGPVSLPQSTRVKRGEKAVAVSLAPPDEPPRGHREDAPRALPSGKNGDGGRDTVLPRVIPPRVVAADKPATTLPPPGPAPSPKKKVIQWP